LEKLYIVRKNTRYRTIPLITDFSSSYSFCASTISIFTPACDGCLFWVLGKENHPVMVAEDLIHSWGLIKTCEVMEKFILSYQCILPWSNMQ
jgi:hypothetical protein